MYFYTNSAVFRPQWQPDLPEVLLTPPDASVLPLSSPRCFAWFQKTPDWQRDSQWAIKLIPSLTPGDTSQPPRRLPEKFRNDQFVPEWIKIQPWQSQEIKKLTPRDTSAPPTIQGQTFTWFQKAPEWNREQQWMNLLVTELTPTDTSQPPLRTPIKFRNDQFLPDWQKVQPWQSYEVNKITPADTSRPPLIRLATQIEFLKTPDWQLIQPWVNPKPGAEFLPSAGGPVTVAVTGIEGTGLLGNVVLFSDLALTTVLATGNVNAPAAAMTFSVNSGGLIGSVGTITADIALSVAPFKHSGTAPSQKPSNLRLSTLERLFKKWERSK